MPSSATTSNAALAHRTRICYQNGKRHNIVAARDTCGYQIQLRNGPRGPLLPVRTVGPFRQLQRVVRAQSLGN